MTGWKKSEPVIQVDKVSRYFGKDCVLKEAELTLYEGQVCGIVGNNGSGKTVLMKCICGFLPDLTGFRNLEILAFMNRRITPAQIRLIMKKVGLDPEMKKSVEKYSLGMRQRLGIAQAIMEEPELLVLDEPFNGLDKQGVEDMRKILLELKAQGKTILLASHNEDDIRILCDRVFEMDGGVLKEREESGV